MLPLIPFIFGLDLINMNEDTIAAVATGITGAGIGIIRVSGTHAVSVCQPLFKGAVSLDKAESHKVYYGHIVKNGLDGDLTLDEVLITVFLSPRSYTKEDVVEISCHGGSFVISRILSLILEDKRVRLADPGEFTKRAFLNGRIDLSQAESVMNIISSDNENMLRQSMRQLQGDLSNKIHVLREDMLHEMAYVEAALDDPEHYDLTGYSDNLLIKINDWNKQIKALINSAREGRIMRDGIKAVIVGRPNVGKSSLLNALAKTDRAIVTDIPGTTRDIIEEKVYLSDIVLALTDTAGIRQTQDVIEQIGVNKSIDNMEEADIILWLMDASDPFSREDLAIEEHIVPEKTIVVLNKSDLININKDVDKLYSDRYPIVNISAKFGTGFNDLAEIIKMLIFEQNVDKSVDIFILNERHARLLADCSVSLSLVDKSITDGMPEDLFLTDLMDAYQSLGFILGEELEDDLVDKIFSEFCMGK